MASAQPALSQAADMALGSGAVRVLSYEPFIPSVLTPAAKTSRKANLGTLTRLQFDAYGRRFELALEKNTRLTRALDLSTPTGPTLSLYQGRVANIPSSWVRLSAQGQAIRGMIWDGRELYVVELADAVLESQAIAPPSAQQKSSSARSIIFRLSDTEIAPGASFCAQTQSAPIRNGKAGYSQLLRELKGSPAIMQAVNASLRLELSALGDSLFRQRYGTEQQARDEILVRLNNVDGIYSSEFGVEIQVPTLQVKDTSNDPFSTTRVAEDLLVELKALRQRTPELRARGLTHLFTGRNLLRKQDLNDSTVGIAYTDTLCGDAGVGMTEINSRDAWIESLITAHEIGHNFGAVHDGEGQCSATAQNQYIMSPTIADNAVAFSQCSRDTIAPRVQSATCITPLTPPDLSVPADLGTVHKAVSKPFDWELTVTNIGGSTAAGAAVKLLVPPVVTIDEAWVPGRSCTSGAGVILCDLGDIAAAGSRVVHLVLRSDVVGSNSISAQIDAQSDSDLSNNSGNGTLVVDPEADLGVTLQAPGSIAAGSSATVAFTASNLALIDAANITVGLNVSGIEATAATLDGGACSVAAASVSCTLPTMAAKATANGTLTIKGSAAGSARVQAAISGGYVDPNASNDSSTHDLTVVTAGETQASGRGGGGGGASGVPFLAGLAGLAGLLAASRARPTRPARQTAGPHTPGSFDLGL